MEALQIGQKAICRLGLESILLLLSEPAMLTGVLGGYSLFGWVLEHVFDEMFGLH